MTAAKLLERVQAEGFTLTLGAAGALIVAPASRLTEELRAELRAHKAEVLAALAGPRSSALTPDLDAHRAPQFKQLMERVGVQPFADENTSAEDCRGCRRSGSRVKSPDAHRPDA